MKRTWKATPVLLGEFRSSLAENESQSLIISQFHVRDVPFESASVFASASKSTLAILYVFLDSILTHPVEKRPNLPTTQSSTFCSRAELLLASLDQLRSHWRVTVREEYHSPTAVH